MSAERRGRDWSPASWEGFQLAHKSLALEGAESWKGRGTWDRI